jgi:hypothetical protein
MTGPRFSRKTSTPTLRPPVLRSPTLRPPVLRSPTLRSMAAAGITALAGVGQDRPKARPGCLSRPSPGSPRQVSLPPDSWRLPWTSSVRMTDPGKTSWRPLTCEGFDAGVPRLPACKRSEIIFQDHNMPLSCNNVRCSRLALTCANTAKFRVHPQVKRSQPTRRGTRTQLRGTSPRRRRARLPWS